MSHAPYKFAILGLGPRGGYALECLVRTLAETPDAGDISLTLFEEAGPIGSGPVYQPEQPETNWINITERALALEARAGLKLGPVKIDAFPSYHSWAGLEFDSWPLARIDTFPQRAKIGRYLHERCTSLVTPLIKAGLATLVRERVDGIKLTDKACEVITQSGAAFTADDVLLTVGHQPAAEDPQSKAWSEAAPKFPNLAYYAAPYPAEDLILKTGASGAQPVALRGYGLAMIDVARALATRYGRFTGDSAQAGGLRYECGQDGFVMAPFSLDGLAMGPKPHTPLIDAQYTPTETDINAVRAALSDRAAQKRATGTAFLTDVMVPLIAKTYKNLERNYLTDTTSLEDIEKTALAWLQDPATVHDLIMPTTGHPADTLRRLIDMAFDTAPISLDYCAGQVWRHCQPALYESLSYSALSNEVMADIIALDEQSKRYSFGPPVESLMQLVALHNAGVLNLDVLSGPDISFGADGWTLTSGSSTFTAATMINTVLDGPAINDITSPLLASLLDKDVIQPAHDELGVLTDKSGYVLSGRDDSVLPIALLGRIAKGTVIGVDAILECFGERPLGWARAAVDGLQRRRRPPNQSQNQSQSQSR